MEDIRISYKKLHERHRRATPQEMMKYKLSLQLHKAYNDQNHGEVWLHLNFQQQFGQRKQFFNIFDMSSHKVGKILLTNRLNVLNGRIKYEWLNLTTESFKIKMKNIFLSSQLTTKSKITK